MNGKQDYGALYVAFGVSYLAMALLSASTLRKTNPGIPFCIVSNVDFNPADFDFWDKAKDHFIKLSLETKENRCVKTSAIDYSPFDKTVYIDCDTFINGDLSDGALLLDYFDIAFRGDTEPPKCDVPVIGGYPVRQFPHWNSGIFLFNKSIGSRDFFKKWQEGFRKYDVEFDQVSLVEALFTTSARMISLDGRWNFMSFYSYRSKEYNQNAKVVHYTSRISFAIEKELLDMCKMIPSVPDAKKQLNEFIAMKRHHRKVKIGTYQYIKLKIKWLLYP
ncbi:MAG: glycosyltransferase [Deltaproteobacteria bacterium]|nr:glycosyltransferase [Deltaproteobacteria bacterium]